MKVISTVLILAMFSVSQSSSGQLAERKPLDMAQAVRAAQARQPGPSTNLQTALDEYELWNLKHRAATFQWQFTASRIIFWMVISLVLAGVAFSAIQFRVALRRRTEFSDAELALSVEGVKIRSQFLGVITLALSLGFFYLYLKTVYPIVELPAHSVENVQMK